VVPANQDEVLAHAYLRFQADGLLPMVFSEGETSLRWFLETYRSMHVVAGMDGERLAGLGWLNKIIDMGTAGWKADCGMAFFPEISPWSKVRLGELFIDCAFEELNLQGLFGTTPEPNRRALRYAKKLGFQLHGPIPAMSAWEGKICAAYISSMTRQQWLQKLGGSR